MIIKKEKKEKKSVAMVEVRSCEVNPDIDPRKHPQLLGTKMLRVITNVFQMLQNVEQIDRALNLI